MLRGDKNNHEAVKISTNFPIAYHIYDVHPTEQHRSRRSGRQTEVGLLEKSAVP